MSPSLIGANISGEKKDALSCPENQKQTKIISNLSPKSQTLSANKCFGDCDFIPLPQLLSSFRGMQQLQEWNDQATVQSVVDRLNVFQFSLENNAGHCNYGN